MEEISGGRVIHTVLLVWVLSCAGICARAQSSSYSVPSGFVRVQVQAETRRYVSIPFAPFDPSINALFNGQLTGASNEQDADKVYFWDSQNQIEIASFKADNTGDANKDGKWFAADSDWMASPFYFSPGDAFSVGNSHSTAQTVFLFGKLIMDSGRNRVMHKGMNLFSYPFSAQISLNSTCLAVNGASGAASQQDSDIISPADSPAVSYWLLDDDTSPKDGKWLDASSDLASLHLIPGKAYWYENTGVVHFQWGESRPYGSKWVNLASDAPAITAMSINSALDQVTLDISCTGASGETLDILFKDFSESGDFDIESPWSFAAVNISTNSQNSISWTDYGEANPTSPVVSRAPVTSPYLRLYMVIRRDIDSDSDGLSDGEEIFVHKTDPHNPDTDGDTLSDGAEVYTHGTDPKLRDTDGDGYSDAVEIAYNSDPNLASSTPVVPLPDPPADLAVSAIGNSTVALTWSAPAAGGPVDGYLLFRNGTAVAKTTDTGAVDFKLVKDVGCTYYVKSFGPGENLSDASDSVSAVPGQSSATKFYVDSANGNDGNSGLQENLSKRSIQSAINAAAEGDVIIVAEGTYEGNICLSSKNLTILSTGGPEKTVIDCSPLNCGRGLHITGISPYSCIIEGFTIKSGNPGTDDGGGILVENASPVIADCVVRDNSARKGGGIAISGSGASPAIVNCLISGNSASSDGGGIYFEASSTPAIRSCIIKNNNSSGRGAGIHGD